MSLDYARSFTDGLRQKFSAATMSGGFGAFAPNNNQTRDITVEDIAPNKDFHIDAPTATSRASVQSASISNVDTGAMRSGVEAVKNDYLQTDALIKDTVIEAARSVMGKEAGDKLMGQILPQGGPTHKQAFAVMADPTGTVGALYSVMNSIKESRSETPRPEVLEQMEKILSHIQQQTQQQQTVTLDGNPPPKPPEGLDFNNINAEELLGFMERNVANDPVIQEADDALQVIDDIERNQEYALEHDAQVVTADKIAATIESGDTERLVELVGDEDMAVAVEKYAAHAVDVVCDGLQSPGLVKANQMNIQFASLDQIKAGLADENSKLAAENAAALARDQQLALRQSAQTIAFPVA